MSTPAGLGVVVEHQRQPGGLGDRAVEGGELARVAAVAQRRQAHERVRAGRRRRRRRARPAGAGVPADTPGDQRHPARDRRGDRRDDVAALRGAEAARLAHRPGPDDAVHAGVEQRARRCACSAASSTSPEAANGVVTAGMMPGKRTGALLGRGSCSAARAGCAGWRRRRRRRGRRPRWPRRSCGARRHGGGRGRNGDRLVAQALPQRLVHDRGDVVGERDEHRVGGHDRDLAVEEAVALVPVGAVGVLGRRGPCARAAPRRRGRAGRGGPRARRPGARAARAPRAARWGWRRGQGDGAVGPRRRCTRSTASAATNEPAPGRVSITPWSCSAAIASRTDERPTSRRCARSRSDGSRSPGLSSPMRISPAIRSAICS